jgi:primosomal protein N' (replication factor Y)
MHQLLVALNNRLLGEASLVYAQGQASPGDLVEVSIYNKKFKGIVLKEADKPPAFLCKTIESDFVPQWLLEKCEHLMQEYPINCYEILELGRRWRAEPHIIVHLRVFNYVPQGSKEKELLRMLREKPLPLTKKLNKTYGKQIERLKELGVLEEVVVPPDSYALSFARLVKPSLLIPTTVYERFGNRPLPKTFWRKILNPLVVEQLKDEGAMVEETHLVRSVRIPLDNSLPLATELPETLDELPNYLRYLMVNGQKTLVIFPTIQMAREFARILVSKKVPCLLDSGGYTKLLEDTFNVEEGGLVIGTPRSMVRPWHNLRHIIVAFEKAEDLAVRTASQRIRLSALVPKGVNVDTFIPKIECNLEIDNVQRMKDIDVLAHLKDLDIPFKKKLFLVNRLGFSASLQCQNCGFIVTCPECGTPMRYHRRTRRLACHRCGYIMQIPDKCPRCSSLSLEPYGIGIERVELQLGTKSLRTAKDLSTNTVVSTTKIFRYLPTVLFDDTYYVSADADLAIPIPVPEKRFLRNLRYLQLFTKKEGTVHVLTRDSKRVNDLLDHGEEIVYNSLKSMGLPPFGHYIEVDLFDEESDFGDAVVWGPVPIYGKKIFRYFVITEQKPKDVLSRVQSKIDFASFDVI